MGHILYAFSVVDVGWTLFRVQRNALDYVCTSSVGHAPTLSQFELLETKRKNMYQTPLPAMRLLPTIDGLVNGPTGSAVLYLHYPNRRDWKGHGSRVSGVGKLGLHLSITDQTDSMYGIAPPT